MFQLRNAYSILVLCSGNKGRSACFSAYLKYLIKRNGTYGISVDSAGTRKDLIEDFERTGNLGAGTDIIEILNAKGIAEINDHKVKLVSDELISDADLVLCVDEKNRKRTLERFPGDKKIYTVKGFIYPDGDDSDIKDACEEGTRETYERMVMEIKLLAEKSLYAILDDLNIN